MTVKWSVSLPLVLPSCGSPLGRARVFESSPEVVYIELLNITDYFPSFPSGRCLHWQGQDLS